MAEVTAALVKELRDKTGAGMMDCKRALGDTGGDLEAAVDWLRKKGLAAAAKKAGRVAAEGLVGVNAKGGTGAVVEVNSETDFVARNELFQVFVRTVGQPALTGTGSLDSLQHAANPQYLESASVPGSALDRERAVLSEQAKTSGKADEIIDKMVEGRLRKFYEDNVLLEQIYVIDGESRVSKVLEAAAKEAGAPI